MYPAHIRETGERQPPSAGFGENKAGLTQDFLTRRCALFRRFRPVFSARGSGRGSKRDPRFLIASDKALPYNKAVFLTEYPMQTHCLFP